MTSVGQDFSRIASKATSPPRHGPRRQWSILSLEASVAHAQEEGKPDVIPLAEDDVPTSMMRPLLQKSSWKPVALFIGQNMVRVKKSLAKLRSPPRKQELAFTPNHTSKRRFPTRPAPMQQPQVPDISDITVSVAVETEYSILISMYEVYNDRIFDLLAPMISGNCNTNGRDHHQNNHRSARRYLLFKPTEGSPDRKVVTGLKKVICGSYEEALMVLDTGLTERRVAGTGSNSVSSRSHGFFIIELKRRTRGGMSSAWTGASLTIVDLAGTR